MGGKRRLAVRTAQVIFLLASIARSSEAQTAQCSPAATSATTWARWECKLEGVVGNFTGRRGYADTKLKVTFSSPGGDVFSTYAFWDGGTGATSDKARFTIRFAFPKSSTNSTVWSWSTSCETASFCGAGTATPSLTTSGTVTVSNYSGTNALYLRGFWSAITLGWDSPGGATHYWSSLRTESNTPVVWIGDTAWAAPMKATDSAWLTYVNDRKESTATNAKLATVIQIGPASAWAGSTDAENNAPFTSVSGCTPAAGEPIVPTNCSLPGLAFWRNFEDKIKVANDAGLQIFVSGFMEPRSDHPGTTGQEDFPAAAEAKYFARWLASRLAGDHVIMSPGFDAPPITKNGLQLQRAVGQELEAVDTRHLKSNHWGTNSTGQMDDLQTDSWLDFQMFQSGQNSGASQLTLLTQRARELAWQMSGTSNPPVSAFVNPRKPAVNGEAIYDHNQQPNGYYVAYRARQAGYLSWLSGSFGYTFGVGGIWDWGLCGVPTPNPCGYQIGIGYRSYAESLNKGSSVEIKHLGNLMRSYQSNNEEYMDTYEQTCGSTPSGQGCILNNPSQQEKKMVVARGSNFLVAYMPWNATIKLSTFGMSFNPDWGWLFDPKDGTAETVRVGTVANYTCDSGGAWCEWSNRRYLGNNAPASDRVFYISAPQIPAGFWSGESAATIQVLSGSLIGQNRSPGPWGIIAQLSDQDGAPTGEPFYVSSERGVQGTHPAAARDGEGRFLVAWQSDADLDGWQEIRAQWLNRDGELSGESFRVSPEEERDQFSPSVALDASGNAVVVWTTTDSIPGAHSEVWGQAVDAFGSLVGGQEQLLAGAGYDFLAPKIAASADGVFTLVWTRRDMRSAEFTLSTRQLSSLMGFKGSTVELSSGRGLAPWVGAVVVDAAGKATIDWEDRRNGKSTGSFRQRLNVAGRKDGGLESIQIPGLAE